MTEVRGQMTDDRDQKAESRLRGTIAIEEGMRPPAHRGHRGLRPGGKVEKLNLLTELEKKLIASIQEDIAVTKRPYLDIAVKLGISEETLLESLQDLCNRGFIRRFGATLRHQKTGFSANAMVAWQVGEDRVDDVGNKMASFRQVSHCYRRNPTTGWPYNLYTMIHANDKAACRQTAREMSQAASVEKYTLLFSRRELKKTSMVYFPSDEDD